MWVGSEEVVPITGIPETIIFGVQRVELDRHSIPEGASTPMTVEVSVSPSNHYSAIAMIRRGNP
jgi:hypothetical protein